MGRRQKERKFVQKHVRIREDFAAEIDAEVEKHKTSSFNEGLDKRLEKSFKVKATKYKGFRFIEHMSKDYICFECQERKPVGKPAWLDDETGGTLCPKCAEFKHGLSSDVNVDRDQKLWQKKKLLKDYKHELDGKRQELEQLSIEIENKEIIKKIFDELKEGKETAYRVLGLSGTPEDFKLTAEGLLRWMDKKEKILDVILTKKEKEAWEKLKEEQRKKKRQKQVYAS